MNPCDIQTLCGAVAGELVGGDGTRMTSGTVSTDTRTIDHGALFIALKGDRFDAHDFLGEAVKKGAACLVVNHLPEGFDPGAAGVIQVSDTLIALQRLARWYRELLDVVVVGITGSNGKTTTKDFTASVLRQRFKVHATVGNLNNHIGVPLTILSAAPDTDVFVLEMGMNHPGEIAPLCEIARPHLGIITNIGTAHIEFMGSRDSIAEEKGALARCLPEVGTLIMPAGCDYVDYFRRRSQANTIAVGNGRGAIRAEQLTFDAEGASFELITDRHGAIHIDLPVAGRHMVTNSLLAAAAGWTLGLTLDEIRAGLEEPELTGGRLKRYQSEGVIVFDDTYNANPESVRAAIETLADQPVENGHTKTVVLGMMAELGSHADEMHRAVGRHAAENGIRVISVGEEAESISEAAREAGADTARHFTDYRQAADWLRASAHAGDYVLFKGSRLAAVESVMNEAFPKD
ncbi:MAG: UDP-N-acetylmuramoyl-tripeptide--D-alanyl-D-alanine ligase [Akkermansiaceae bacterium]|nr:UDP-N-acetylmuramoyl-tripeptide--D-alanyl-D-alanine ligase [Akkermansiaceae bacterium]NNM30355.1 UDP-N-acetylmuramoyl-tripeptide--D-alanyl-D-alanine ligase [Akkermansiaceae bacterium]